MHFWNEVIAEKCPCISPLDQIDEGNFQETSMWILGIPIHHSLKNSRRWQHQEN